METFLKIFFFQAEDGIRDYKVTGVQTCALPISSPLTALRAAAGRQTPSPSSRAAYRQSPRSLPARCPCAARPRSEERRVGKEGRSRGAPDHLKKKKR